MNELKYCKFCDKEKPVKDFCKSGSAIKNICRECQNKKQTQIYRNSKKVDKLQKQLIKEKDNWNNLKKYIRKTKLKEFEKSYGKRYGKTFTQAELIVCNMILDKMKEIEQGSDNGVKK